MKTSIFELAEKLAKITNKPIDFFYEKKEETKNVVENDELEKQQEKETIEYDKYFTMHTPRENINEDRISTSVNAFSDKNSIATLASKYEGEVSINGKIINFKKNMTRKEYLHETKKMSQDQVLNHPLLFVFFRSEDQDSAFFHEWLSKFPKET